MVPLCVVLASTVAVLKVVMNANMWREAHHICHSLHIMAPNIEETKVGLRLQTIEQSIHLILALSYTKVHIIY